jgi:hypothetical protein
MPYGELGEDGLVDLSRMPCGDGGSSVEEHFEKSDHADVVDADTRKLCGSNHGNASRCSNSLAASPQTAHGAPDGAPI